MLIWRGGEILPQKQILPLILVHFFLNRKETIFYSKLVGEGILSIKTTIKKICGPQIPVEICFINLSSSNNK